MNTYIVSVTAEDRVGIVQSVTETIRDQGGNIVELSQTVMRDYFTIILAVEFPGPRNARTLSAAIIAHGGQFNLTVDVIDASEAVGVPAPGRGEKYILTVLGDDQPGTIHAISGCLARQGVNIDDLHARVDAGTFSMIMEVFLPSGLSPAAVRDEIDRYCKGRGLKAFVQHENIFLATTEPRPVRVGPAPEREGVAVVPH